MANNSNVIDVPRPAGANDLLGIDNHVESLVEFISSAQMPTTLAIQGEWGSGKTSLMNQIRYRLCEISELENNQDIDKPYYGIWINTWQYSLMKSPNETLLSIIQGITEEVMNIMQSRHPKKMDKSLNKVGSMLGKLAKFGAKTVVSAVGLDNGIVDELLTQEDGKSVSDSSPTAFRNALSDAIKKCLEEDAKVGNANRGFLFFIDDLDRLDPPVAVQILELLKNLFEVENCIFILAIDYDVVVKGLVPKFGPLTEKNEREFRSFFDKIIQLPFTMPMSTYRIDTYLSESLANIGYYTKEETSQPFGSEKKKLANILAEMVELSTGTNPRAIKRLINTLSLILIMNRKTEDTLKYTDKKLLTFCLVCIQIAYPTIYNLLLFDADIKSWNEKTATQFRMPPIESKELEILSQMEEFDEEWEQIIYRACQHNSYLASRALFISRLFNLIISIIPKNQDIESEIERVLGMASVTTINSSEAIQSVEQKHIKRVRLQGPDQLFSALEAKGAGNMVNIAKTILDNILATYGNFVKMEISPKLIILNVTRKKAQVSRLLQIQPRIKDVGLRSAALGDKDTWVYINSLDSTAENGLREDFYDILKKHFMNISEDSI